MKHAAHFVELTTRFTAGNYHFGRGPPLSIQHGTQKITIYKIKVSENFYE